MGRRALIIFLLSLNIFLIAGCWDRNEPEDLGIVTGLGIDQGSGGKIRIIIQTLNTSALSKTGGGRGVEFEKGYRNTAVEGDTIADALNKLVDLTATKRFLSHTNLFIISEDLARQRGIQDIVDFMERDPQIRLDAWFIVSRGSLNNLLDVPGRLTASPCQRISDIVKFNNDAFSYAPLKVAEFVRLLESESGQPYTGLVEIQPNPSFTNDKGHGILDGTVPEPMQNTVMNGTAVFKGDKMVGWLNRNESKGLLWLRGDTKQGTLTFSPPGKEPKKVTTIIRRAKSTLEPEIRDGQVYMTVKVKVDTFLDDNQAGVQPDKPAELGKVESAQGVEIKHEIQAALDKAQQEYQVDIFGFGEAVHRKYPREWKQMKKDWAGIFPTVKVKVQVKSTIEHTLLTVGGPELRQ